MALMLFVGYVGGTRNDQIISAVAPVLGFKAAAGTLDLASTQDVYRALTANFDGDLDKQKLIDGASKGVVAAAGDDYTVYMNRKEAEDFNKELTGNIGGGIGAEIGSRNNRPTVIRTLPDTPAQKAGVQAGDAIVAVNDEASEAWSVSDTVDKIRGEVGTTVKLTILRDNQPKEITITREKITSPSVDSEVVDGIGIITMRRFDDTTTDLARKAALEFKQQNVKGVVLDLRGNGGGLLSAAQSVSGLWLRDKVVVSERTRGKTTDELKSGGNPVLEGVATVVLTNGSSASASEIVAGALQDHGAATLIGEKTFGKGSVQKLINMDNGAVLKVTIAKWYTPKGKNINKEGISPDKKVDLTAADVNAGKDPQLDAAKAHLAK